MSRPKGGLARAFDAAERQARDVARTLQAPAWNEFKAASDLHPAIFRCPAGCTHIRDVGVDTVVTHLARRHSWEPDTIVRWLETIA